MSVPGVVFGQTMGRSRVNLIAYEERQAETQMSSRPKNATEPPGGLDSNFMALSETVKIDFSREEILLPKNAHTDPPPIGSDVLRWQDGWWTAAAAGRSCWGDGFGYDLFPYWRPMPPAPGRGGRIQGDVVMSEICYSAWKRLNDVCIEHGLDVKAQPDEAAEWLSAKLDCARTRDARVEQPGCREVVLVSYRDVWTPMRFRPDTYERAGAWQDMRDGLMCFVTTYPYWRPMPPAPGRGGRMRYTPLETRLTEMLSALADEISTMRESADIFDRGTAEGVQWKHDPGNILRASAARLQRLVDRGGDRP